MPKCPKCGEEVTRLNNVQSGLMCWSMDSEGNYEGSTSDFQTDDGTNDWRCPMCDHTITADESEAIAFLKGEKNG